MLVMQAENRAAEFERQTNKMQKENEALEGKQNVFLPSTQQSFLPLS